MINTKELQKEEIRAALELVREVFNEFEAPEYCEEGVMEFFRFIDAEAVAGRMDSGEMRMWAGYLDGALAGIIATLGKDHICLLFVRREYQRQGVARRLFECVKDACKYAAAITVNSSPYAVEVYRHLGFTATDGEQVVSGIRFTPMEYRRDE